MVIQSLTNDDSEPDSDLDDIDVERFAALSEVAGSRSNPDIGIPKEERFDRPEDFDYLSEVFNIHPQGTDLQAKLARNKFFGQNSRKTRHALIYDQQKRMPLDRCYTKNCDHYDCSGSARDIYKQVRNKCVSKLAESQIHNGLYHLIQFQRTANRINGVCSSALLDEFRTTIFYYWTMAGYFDPILDVTWLKVVHRFREREYKLDNFIAHSDDGAPLADGEDEPPTNYLDEICGGIHSMAKSIIGATSTVYEFVKKVIQKTFQTIGSVCSFMSTQIQKATQTILRYFFKLFAWVDDKIHHHVQDYKIRLVGAIVSTAAIVLGAAGLLTWGVTRFLLKQTTDVDIGPEANGTSPDFVAHGPSEPDLVKLVSGVAIGSLGYFSHSTEKEVMEKTRYMITLSQGGNVLSETLRSLLYLVPESIRTAFTHQFGTKAARDGMKIENWVLHSAAILKLSKTPSVLVSETYYENVQKAVKEGLLLLSTVKSAEFRPTILRYLGDLSRLDSTLTQFVKERTARPVPYALHIAGRPGCGKSLTYRKLLREAFGILESQTYVRPIQDEYWSGFVEADAIVYDEFMVGPDQEPGRQAMEILGLVSSTPYKPPLPSLDSVASGIKGTTANPKVVFTMNNTGWPAFTNKDALHRRRRYVIWMATLADAPLIPGSSNIDTSKYTPQEMADLAWIRFNIYPAEWPGTDLNRYRYNKHPLTFNQLVEFLKPDYEKYMENYETLSDAIGSNLGAQPIAKTIIQETLASYNGISQAKSIGSAFSDLFTAHGPGKKKKSAFKNQGEILEADIRQGMEHDHITNMPTSAKGLVMQGNDLTRYSVEVLNDPSLPSGTSTPRSNCTEHSAPPHPTKRAEAPILSVPSGGYTPMDDTLAEMLDTLATNVVRERPFSSNAKSSDSDCASVSTDDALSVVEPLQNDFPAQSAYVHNQLSKIADGLPKTVLDDENGAWRRAVAGRSERTEEELRAEQYLRVNAQNDACDIAFTADQLDETNARRVAELITSQLPSEAIMSPPGSVIEEAVRHVTNNNHFQLDYYGSPWAGVSLAAVVVILLTVVAMLVYLLKRRLDLPTFAACGGDRSVDEMRVSRPGHKSRKVTKGYISHGSHNPVCELIYGTHTLYGVPVKDRKVLTYSHGLPVGENVAISAKLKHQGRVHDIVIQPDLVTRMESRDLALIDLSNNRTVPPFKNITRLFPSDNDMSAKPRLQVAIGLDDKVHHVPATFQDTGSYYDQSGVVSYKIDDNYVIPVASRPGHCGISAVAFNDPLNGKIVGLLVAGTHRDPTKPRSMISVVTQEVIQDLDDNHEDDIIDDILDDAIFVSHGEKNLIDSFTIPKGQAEYMNRTSKFRPSAIAKYLPWESDKQPAVLSAKDPRGNGTQPELNAIKELWDVEHPDLNDDVTVEIIDAMEANYRQSVKFPLKHELTFEQACAGVPGLLSSLRVQSSPGYPLNKHSKKKGKRDYIWFDQNGNFHYDPSFKEQVLARVRAIESGDFIPPHHWVGSLKDELVKPEKVVANNTRVVYCGDLISTVAYRMKFGPLIAALNNSTCTPLAIGINPESFDMDLVHNYLTGAGGTHFVAGDYKKFDKRHNPYVQKELYRLLRRLSPVEISDAFFDHMLERETESPCHVGDIGFRVRGMLPSGGLFTTIINCLYNEYNLRRVFRAMNPDIDVSDKVRFKVLGDDHIICFNPSVVNFTDEGIKEQMSLIGHQYTDVSKSGPVQVYDSFEKVTFLGCSPIKFRSSSWPLSRSRYAGALSQDILKRMVLWTKDGDLTLNQKVNMALRSATMWDQNFFLFFSSAVNKALTDSGREAIYLPYHQTRRLAASATADMMNKDCFVAHGGSRPPRSTVPPIVNLSATYKIRGRLGITYQIEENRPDLHYEYIDFKKKTFSYPILYTMYFDGVYLEHVPVHDNVHGTQDPAYFSPSYDADKDAFTALVGITGKNEGVSHWVNVDSHDYTALFEGTLNLHEVDHVTHASLRVKVSEPFGPPNLLSATSFEDFSGLAEFNLDANDGTERLGLYLRYRGRFWETKFSAMQGLYDTEKDPGPFAYLAYLNDEPDKSNRGPLVDTHESEDGEDYIFVGLDDNIEDIFRAHGQGSSRNTVTNIYEGNTIGGSLQPQVHTRGGSQTVSPSTKIDAEIPIPMDNPALLSGSIATMPQYNGMAKVVGVEQSVAMQLNPMANATQGHDLAMGAENSIKFLSERKYLIDNFSWTKTASAGSLLKSFNLNSVIGTNLGDVSNNQVVGVPIATAQLGLFWRGTIEFEIDVVRTAFHSGRLRFTIGYGAPPSVVANHLNVFYNEIVDFNDSKETTVVSIPFNAQTEYLQTAANDGLNPIQDFSLGTLAISVATELQAPSTMVPDAVDVLVFARFRDLQLAVPSNIWPFLSDEFESKITLKVNASTEAQDDIPDWVAHGAGGLTTFKTEEANAVLAPQLPSVASRAVNEQAMDLSYGLDSYMYRTSIAWSKDDDFGKSLFTTWLPWGMLNLGSTDNIQNMPFQNFIYWHGKVSVMIQLNGMSFQTGRLIAYFYPLGDGTTLDIHNATSCHHVIMTPKSSTTAELEIPFVYPRSVLNTYAQAENAKEAIGTLCIRVLSPLVSDTGDPVTVTLFSKFPESKFSIPRPVGSAADFDASEIFIAHGDGTSTTNSEVGPPGTVHLDSDSAVANVAIHVEENTAADDPHATPVGVTSELANVTPARPCSLKTGDKFEYQFATVQDLIRRHQRWNWWEDIVDAGQERTVGKRSTLMINVVPRFGLSSWYAGYSGSLKLRIFVNRLALLSGTVEDLSGGSSKIEMSSAAGNTTIGVTFVPYNMRDYLNTSTGPKISDVYVESAIGNGGMTITYRNDPPSTSTATQSDPGMGNAAREVLWDTAQASYIDIAIPFQTIYNFLATPWAPLSSKSTNSFYPTGLGVLLIDYDFTTLSHSSVNDLFQIYQAAGDDFVFHNFRPPLSLEFDQISGDVTTDGALPVQIGQYYYPAATN